MTFELGLLGDVEARLNGQPVDIGPARQRCVLVALAVDVNQPVSVERLAVRIWGERAPFSARATLSSYLTRLRHALTRATDVDLGRRPGGYLLTIDAAAVDLHRFRSLVTQARAATDDLTTESLLDQAIGLWRGEPFAGLDSPWLTGVRDVLNQERHAAQLDRTDLQLRRGQYSVALAMLSTQAVDHPLDERIAAQLMLALAGSGQQAAALRHFTGLRQRLVDELGIEPGPELRTAHLRVLRQGVATTISGPRSPSRRDPAPAGGQGSTTRQLPHDIANFTGRFDELAGLEALAAARPASRARHAPTIVTIDGAPGIGKTTFAVHWAHRVAHRYPDVQLYLNLHGYGPGEPVTPATAIEALLRGLGVDSELIPPGVEERSALLRSTLAGRRVLVLLDNASNADQVRPLLPGTASLVIVTSRNQLRGLSVRDGAHRVTLHPLPRDQAVELLAGALGPERVATEPAAATRLVELCDRLPLALAIVAERALRRGSLAEVVAELADEKARLDNLGSGENDPHTDLRAALSWSYQALGPDAAALFRKLGLHPANDIGVETAAALADVPVAQAKASLDQLVTAHLVEQRQPRRYELHDLTRIYACEMASRHLRPSDREAAVRRVLDWYLHAAVSADSHLMPHRRRDFVVPYEPQAPPPVFADPLRATAWFDQEYGSLRSVAWWAAANGWAGHTWRIAMAMTTFFDNKIPWHDGLEFYDMAHRTAQSADERIGEGFTLNSLGCIYLDKGQWQAAASHFRQASTCFHDVADRRGEAMALGNLGLVCGKMGEHDEGRRHSAIALNMCEELNYPRGIALNLDNLGVALTVAGEYKSAIDCHRQAHEINIKLGDAHSDAWNQHNLGCAYAGLGDTINAIRAFRAAISTHRALGNRRWEAIVLTDLASTLDAAGHPGLARCMREAALVTTKEFAGPRERDIQSAPATLP